MGEWLRGLGLERYVSAFEDNDIDADVLPELNEIDLELRTATRLGRMLGEQARRAEAYDVLAPVYDWFTGGHGTVDLMNAEGCLTSFDD